MTVSNHRNQSYDVEYTLSPNREDIDFLSSKINARIVDITRTNNQFASFIRKGKHNIIGGCNGFVAHDTLYVEQLWVHSDYRQLGLGSKLMDRAHLYGNKVGCKVAHVATIDLKGDKHFFEKMDIR